MKINKVKHQTKRLKERFKNIFDLQQMLTQKRDIKILVSADPRGRLQFLFGKVNALHQKNKFDFMLMLGEVCHSRSSKHIASLKNQANSLQIPIFFIDNSELSPVLHQLHPQGFKMANNLNYLGTSGIFTVDQTVIAYFSFNHKWSQKAPLDQHVKQLINLCRGKDIDILMTNQWSKQVKGISDKPNAKSMQYVSKLVAGINPHYHLAAGGEGFYRMNPYRNGKDSISHFICVAPLEQQPKDKYLFAFTLKPGWQEPLPNDTALYHQNPYQSDTQTAEKPQNSVLFAQSQSKHKMKDYLSQKSRQPQQITGQTVIYFQGFADWARNSQITQFLQRWGDIKRIQINSQLSKGFRCGFVSFIDIQSTKACLGSSQLYQFHTKRIKFSQKYKQIRSVADCWFCKQNADTSLMLFQGKYFYLSMEKGPLSKYHFQLIPNEHVQNVGRLDHLGQAQINSTLLTLNSHFQQKQYQCIVYERYLPLSQAVNHCVVHFIPVTSQNSLLKKFQSLNRNDGLGFKPSGSNSMRKSPFYLMIAFGQVRFIKEVNKRDRIQADYMRVIVSQILGQARLANWKQCVRKPQVLEEQRQSAKNQLRIAGILEQ